MGNYFPMTSAQFAARDVFHSNLPLLDDEFDPEIDFQDAHLAALEITNQYTSTND